MRDARHEVEQALGDAAATFVGVAILAVGRLQAKRRELLRRPQVPGAGAAPSESRIDLDLIVSLWNGLFGTDADTAVSGRGSARIETTSADSH